MTLIHSGSTGERRDPKGYTRSQHRLSGTLQKAKVLTLGIFRWADFALVAASFGTQRSGSQFGELSQGKFETSTTAAIKKHKSKKTRSPVLGWSECEICCASWLLHLCRYIPDDAEARVRVSGFLMG